MEACMSISFGTKSLWNQNEWRGEKDRGQKFVEKTEEVRLAEGAAHHAHPPRKGEC